MAKCHACQQEMVGGVSCKYPRLMDEHGLIKERVAYGSDDEGWEADDPPEPNCPDCETPLGGYHHDGCVYEHCPICKGMKALCNHPWKRYVIPLEW